MNSPPPQGAAPARRDPFSQLERCHRRLEEAITALREAATTRDMEAASDVSGFFARQIRRHEADEDGSLFPSLTTACAVVEREDAAKLRASLERLSSEHVKHEALHRRLELAVSGRSEADPWSELKTLAEELDATYRAHIEEEERVVFPAARELLSAEALETIAAAMEARRGR